LGLPEAALQVGQGLLEYAAMAGIVDPFELLQNALPGKAQVFKFALPGRLQWAHRRAGSGGLFGCIGLLSLNRFAFPSSCHSGIIGHWDRRASHLWGATMRPITTRAAGYSIEVPMMFRKRNTTAKTLLFSTLGVIMPPDLNLGDLCLNCHEFPSPVADTTKPRPEIVRSF
jgi:hypothetical protein